MHIREALRQIMASKLRAFLAVLGILVGTASLVAMVSIGQLAQDQILAQFRSLGINLLSVSIYPKYENNIESNNNADSQNPLMHLSLKEANDLIESSPNILLVAPYVENYGAVIYQGQMEDADSVGITPAMLPMAQLSIAEGRALSFLDDQDYFCVIGNRLAENLLKNHPDRPLSSLLNTQIQLGENIFTLVGILNPWPSNFFFNTDFNTAVLIPISTALSIQKNASIQNLALRIQSTSDILKTEKSIKTYLEARTLDQQINVRSPKSLIDSMAKSSETMTVLLAFIGGISLIVGGIGIMNIMLVSVAERHREIGIRKAVGAKNKDIILQFLIEAIVLSIFGGLTGMLLGILIAYIVAVIKSWSFALFLLPPLIGGIVTIGVGIFFGFYPAYKASQLDPIETLRSE